MALNKILKNFNKVINQLEEFQKRGQVKAAALAEDAQKLRQQAERVDEARDDVVAELEYARSVQLKIENLIH